MCGVRLGTVGVAWHGVLKDKEMAVCGKRSDVKGRRRGLVYISVGVWEGEEEQERAVE